MEAAVGTSARWEKLNCKMNPRGSVETRLRLKDSRGTNLVVETVEKRSITSTLAKERE